MWRRERREGVLVREERRLWDRSNPLVEYSEKEFRRNFRLSKRGILRLVDLVEEDLSRQNNRGSPLTPLQQVCLCMTFLSSGTFQRTAGVIAGASVSCANTTINRVIIAICRQAPDVIKMPTREQMRTTANFFMAKYGLPNFAYGVDGTFVRLGHRPSVQELPNGVHPQDYWSRKQYYSINVQVIGNEKKMIYNLVSRWAGSTNDARVWANSNAKTWTEAQGDFLIAGDSAYPISRTLMKPYHQPQEQNKKFFNKKLSGIRTECTENLIGLWKRRFPALKMGFRTKLMTSCNAAVASGVVHNLTISWDEPEPDSDDEAGEDDDEDAVLDVWEDPRANENVGQGVAAIRASGQAYRDWMLTNFVNDE